MVQDRMPERVVQVEFSEVQRTPTGLTRVVKASSTCSLFLEKGCVVVRELVEVEGKRVVKSIAVPLNSGMVRTIHLEDEVLRVPERIAEEEARKIVETGFNAPAVQPVGLDHTHWAPDYHGGQPSGLNGKPETTLPQGADKVLAEGNVKEQPSLAPSAVELVLPAESQELVERLKDSGNPALQAVAERMEQQPVVLASHEDSGHVPTTPEEAILNRPRNRRR